MTLLLYGGANVLTKKHQDPAELHSELLAKRAKATKKWVHPKLRFEEIIKNNTIPPCSLNDFVDYLVYVEREAETLQFFLWYCDYIQRWMALPASQKAASPRWDPDNKRPATSTSHSRSSSLKEKAKLDTILDILDSEPQTELHQRSDSTSHNFSLPRTPARAAAADGQNNWEPFTSQPFRDEINRIVRHYVSRGSPRQLNLSPADRAACVHAVEHTTHPSALLPAFLNAGSVLRGRLHPNFIHWSIMVENAPKKRGKQAMRQRFDQLERTKSASSPSPRRKRRALRRRRKMTSGLFAFEIASGSGLCFFLHFANRRQLRPWEQASDLEAGRMKMNADKSAKYLDHDIARDSKMGSVDPLRKATLQTFGPRNEFGGEEWAVAYKKKWLLRRIFDVSVKSHNKYVRVLQDGIVASATLWGGLIAMVLCGGSYFIPTFGIF